MLVYTGSYGIDVKKEALKTTDAFPPANGAIKPGPPPGMKALPLCVTILLKKIHEQRALHALTNQSVVKMSKASSIVLQMVSMIFS